MRTLLRWCMRRAGLLLVAALCGASVATIVSAHGGDTALDWNVQVTARSATAFWEIAEQARPETYNQLAETWCLPGEQVAGGGHDGPAVQLGASRPVSDGGGRQGWQLAGYSYYVRGATVTAYALCATQGGTSTTASASASSASAGGTAVASLGGTGVGTPGSLSATASGAGTVTIAQYGGNPGGAPNFGVGDNTATSAFMDLHASPGNSFTTLTMVNCNLNGATTMFWWTGTAWIVASDQSQTPPGCITMTVTATTSPNIGNLTGTYVAAGTPTGPPLIFADVPTSHPAYEAIRQLNQRGVIRGYGDGNFGPDDSTLRAQMAALIARAMGWDGESHGTAFPDQGVVDDDLWRNVGTLSHYGVAKGYEDGTYNPTGDVLYVQTVLFISRAMVAKGFWQLQPDDPNLYPNLPNATAKERADRRDVATYVHYAGALPDIPAGSGQPFTNWDQPGNRAWFARALWQALVSYYGSPDLVP